MMAPIQISLFWYTYYYFTAWIRWAVKTGELWLSVTRTTGHWSTTEMLRVGGFLVLAGPTTYGRLKTMEASSKWNQIVSTKTHQGKKFRNLIHIRFILVMNSKSNQTVLLFRYFTRFRECTAVRLQYGLSVLTWSGALDSWRQTDSWFSVSVCDSVLVPICIQHLCLRKESTEWIPNMSPELWNTFHINRSRFIIILNHKSNVYNITLPFSKLTQSMQVWAFLNMYK